MNWNKVFILYSGLSMNEDNGRNKGKESFKHIKLRLQNLSENSERKPLAKRHGKHDRRLSKSGTDGGLLLCLWSRQHTQDLASNARPLLNVHCGRNHKLAKVHKHKLIR